MSSKPKKPEGARRSSSRPSRKDQIIALFLSGMGEIEDIAVITGARPSYVGSVLQEAGLRQGYFDLYTSTSHPQNIYSKFFAGKLGFKDVETATESVEVINRLYRQFELAGDRAGQHHALQMALTMFDRARWTGKGREAGVFLNWLTARLGEAALELEEASGESLGEGDEGAAEPETLP
ncbi:MAG TPA: hypothetical protein VF668_17085 [Pyrinomonadaceae bacterium]|jgi:hypothetical protein